MLQTLNGKPFLPKVLLENHCPHSIRQLKSLSCMFLCIQQDAQPSGPISEGLGIRVQGLGFRVQCSGFRV